MAAKKSCRRSSSGNSEKWEVSEKPEVTRDRDEQTTLFMGIPDHITVHHILTKVPWTAMFPISRVNRSWRRLVKSRQLYNARVTTGCTQTLVPIMHRAPMFGNPAHSSSGKLAHAIEEESLYNDAMSVYDPVTDRWHLLPSVPLLLAGIAEGCSCVCLNGKVYVLGGMQSSPNADNYRKESRKDVFSLDLAAADTTWRKCADMNSGRAWFHCGINDGNIYVFCCGNGWNRMKGFGGAVVEVEVYDPEQDLWDIVAPIPFADMLKYSFINKFTTVGETFVIHSYLRWTEGSRITVQHTYDTGKDEWKVVENIEGEICPTEAFVTMNKKLYTIDPTKSTLKVYNEASGSWSSTNVSVLWEFLDKRIEPLPLRPYLQGIFGLSSFLGTYPEQMHNWPPTSKDVQEVLALTLVTGLNEQTILGLTRTSDIISQFRNYPVQLALFKGKWSGHDQLQLVFQEVECPHTLLDWQKYAFCPLQL